MPRVGLGHGCAHSVPLLFLWRVLCMAMGSEGQGACYLTRRSGEGASADGWGSLGRGAEDLQAHCAMGWGSERVGGLLDDAWGRAGGRGGQAG